ncbi:hypothetical protein MtrunA17_Chr7g0241671 [Medicago truncatula]|uniref:Uncharacterized protein n=1 Tax=Medicago truncatula TaxID=3880 RepID=A0A396H610_MEDTR|nr:hypothetical protein MtrunA17_Chr7g0241671 [Medicago truncatula]
MKVLKTSSPSNYSSSFSSMKEEKIIFIVGYYESENILVLDLIKWKDRENTTLEESL